MLVNTGIGMRGWLEAAEGWGLAEPLRAVLARAYLVARGPKARGRGPRGRPARPVVARGRELRGGRRPPRRPAGIAGLTVAIQLHGESQPEYTEALQAAGARVIEVPVYRWAPPTDPAPLHRLVDLITGRLVDAVTFTSAPAVERAAARRRAGLRRAARRVPDRRAGRLRRARSPPRRCAGTAYRWSRRPGPG